VSGTLLFQENVSVAEPGDTHLDIGASQTDVFHRVLCSHLRAAIPSVCRALALDIGAGQRMVSGSIVTSLPVRRVAPFDEQRW